MEKIENDIVIESTRAGKNVEDVEKDMNQIEIKDSTCSTEVKKNIIYVESKNEEFEKETDAKNRIENEVVCEPISKSEPKSKTVQDDGRSTCGRYEYEYNGAVDWRVVFAGLLANAIPTCPCDRTSSRHNRELSISSSTIGSSAMSNNNSDCDAEHSYRVAPLETNQELSYMEATTLFIEYVCQRIPRYKIVHHVVPITITAIFKRLPRSTTNAEFNYRNIQEYSKYNNKTPRAIIISRHSDHFHVVHSCSYSNGTCRCSWTKPLRLWNKNNQFARRRWRSSKVIQFSASDTTLRNLMEYMCRGSRRLCYLHIYPTTWVQCDKIGSLRFQKMHEYRQIQLVERSDISECSSEYRSERSYTETSGETSRHDSDQVGSIKSRKEAKHTSSTFFQAPNNNKLLAFLAKLVVAPVSLLFSMGPWMRSKFVHYNRNLNYFKTTLEQYYYILNQRTTHNCLVIYCSLPESKLYFNAANESIDKYYYNIQQSVDILETLLLYQYKSEESVKAFLIKLFCVVDKIIPKKNFMYNSSAQRR